MFIFKVKRVHHVIQRHNEVLYSAILLFFLFFFSLSSTHGMQKFQNRDLTCTKAVTPPVPLTSKAPGNHTILHFMTMSFLKTVHFSTLTATLTT